MEPSQVPDTASLPDVYRSWRASRLGRITDARLCWRPLIPALVATQLSALRFWSLQDGSQAILLTKPEEVQCRSRRS